MHQSSEDTSSGQEKVSPNLHKEVGNGAWGILPRFVVYHAASDTTLFSTSLPVLPHDKLNLNNTDDGRQSIDDISPNLDKFDLDVENKELLDDVENNAIGSLLPDDEDELLSGIMDGFDIRELPNQVDDLEEFDLFGIGGGMELESDPQTSLSEFMSKITLSAGGVGNGVAIYGFPNSVGTVAGEHPHGEHPSRTLFVRNINSNVEDSELITLFEQYGDIRTLYTACKHRGFVMISYYDIRAARTAMRALQNKPLRRRKLDIHFSIPKDNPSDKDINQGTLVVFNLDPSVSSDDLRQIFGSYGEVKEIRETPHKRHHKFIEFYDVRAAEAALRSLNRSDIAGKRVKLEPSRPGGARRNFMLQTNQELDQDESPSFRHQMDSLITDSPPGSWPLFGSPIEHSPPQNHSNSTGFKSRSPTLSNNLSGLSSLLHPRIPNSTKVAPIGNGRGSWPLFGSPIEHSPPQNHSNSTGFKSRSPTLSNNLSGLSSLLHPRIPNSTKVAPIGNGRGSWPLLGSPIEHSPPQNHSNSTGFKSRSPTLSNNLSGLSSLLHPRIPNSTKVAPIGNGRGTHAEHKFPNTNSNHGTALHQSHSLPEPKLTASSFDGASSSNESGVGTLSGPQFLWGSPTLYPEQTNTSTWRKPSFTSDGPTHGSPFTSRQGSLVGSPHSHVGSAPSSGNPFERHLGFYQNSPETSFMGPFGLGGMRTGSPDFSMLSSHGFSHYPGTIPTRLEGFERGWGRRGEIGGNQIESKKQFQLELDKIRGRDDTRTTLMIKNIPNKYTSKMLLVAIDENHKGTYDFVYLPIDFKNKCNVGYAFINMLSPSHIIPFYEEFNGKKWEKFNSEKVASLAYARIQGKAALVAHFQNSSLMNEDKRCRPIYFHSEGSEAGDQVNILTYPKQPIFKETSKAYTGT